MEVTYASPIDNLCARESESVLTLPIVLRILEAKQTTRWLCADCTYINNIRRTYEYLHTGAHNALRSFDQMHATHDSSVFLFQAGKKEKKKKLTKEERKRLKKEEEERRAREAEEAR